MQLNYETTFSNLRSLLLVSCLHTYLDVHTHTCIYVGSVICVDQCFFFFFPARKYEQQQQQQPPKQTESVQLSVE